MTPEFKNAKLYTCSDGEYITHDSWDQAILELLESDDGCKYDETTREMCERIGPITVDAYNPDPISPGWISSEVDSMMERFEENFNDVYGCDGSDAEPWTSDTHDWAKKVLTANITKSLRSATVYSCVQVGTHTFSVAECIEMMK